MITKELECLGRKKSIELFKGEHGQNAKPDIWVCGYLILSTSKKINCQECGDECYYDTKMKYLFVKNPLKICVKCVLKNHSNKITALEKEMIEEVLKSK